LAIAFSPNGRLLATASYDRTVRLWAVQTGTSWAVLEGHTGGVRAVAFSPDGQLLASASVDNTVRLWNPENRTLRQVLRFDGVVSECLFSALGSYFVTNIGAKPVQSEEGSLPEFPLKECYVMAISGSWLTVDAEKLLWLPHDYRPGRVAGHNNTIAIASESGKMSMIRFDFRNLRPWKCLC
jgi:WD40 repeat protein